MSSGQSSSLKPFHILGFNDSNENVQPLELPDNSTTAKNHDVARGMILCGLVRLLLNRLSTAQDLLNSKNKPPPQTIEQLRSEIEALHAKICAEESRNEDFVNEITQIKQACVEKSDNIQQEIGKLKQFCEHFRSRTFLEQYNSERQLTNLNLDLKMERDLGKFLKARIAVEREKKQQFEELLSQSS